MIRHRCHNRLCANPAHLVVGSKADNKRDDWDYWANGVDYDTSNPWSRPSGGSSGPSEGTLGTRSGGGHSLGHFQPTRGPEACCSIAQRRLAGMVGFLARP
ncbi:HNH endonuclease [Litoreibacter ascidiaceicola]|uniref:HNH endonuclease n=1 Tax=Litoreibacter ascidiaceicola TaxID=1486859 RepID=UPI00093392C6